MKKRIAFSAILAEVFVLFGVYAGGAETPPPVPYGATPTARQVAHAEMEMYAFCHFTVDTFTDREWGGGEEKEELFNPTAFDANQIVNALKAGGLKGVILTCKHHDGFCLWPTKTTTHNVSASPFRDGKGDVVREMMEACAKANMKFGVYVSPWDRNNPLYGTPEYPTKVYREQIRELLTNYGQIFEIWFDGANGGSGYYGGKGGSRGIDRTNYYGWPITWKMVREAQPEAIIFSDVGPDYRWCGNESGGSGDPCRATIDYAPDAAPGYLNASTLGTGKLGGKQWCPAEVDVSIRPGWFWHESQNAHVRSPQNLMGIYLNSVGHGATFNLNVPPDRRGILHENDVASLAAFGEHLRTTFAENLADGAKLAASNVRGGDVEHFGPQRLMDRDFWSAWVTDDEEHTPEVTLELKGEKTFNLIRMREDIRLGLRVEGVAVDAWENGQWKELAKAESIGACHLWRVPATTTGKVRIRVTKSPVCPALSDFGLFNEPEFGVWVPPIGGDPAAAAKAKWKVISTSYTNPGSSATNAIDGSPSTFWHTFGPDGEHHLPQYIAVDMGEATDVTGFTYLPRQDGTAHGMVDRYEFYLSQDGKDWGTAASSGEFGNLRSNPVLQSIALPQPIKARYFKFVATHALELDHAVIAELGILTKKAITQVVPAAAEKRAGDIPIRVMTYNIDHGHGMDGKVNLERTAKVISDSKADLVAIQEVDCKTHRVGGVDESEQLGKLTGLHAVFGKAMDFSGGEYGIVILSRWPILESKTVSLAKGGEPRALLIVNTTAGDGGPPLRFACTHLNESSEPVRLKQLDVLLPTLGADQTGDPLILAGDFNSEPKSAVIERVQKEFTSDTDETVMTWPSDKPNIKIDWIFHRPADRFAVVGTKVIDEPMASDHRPVVVDYRLHR